ncbi:MAG TPA: SAM-dependent methyltransferase, partial [Mycobacterium sp.]|nr:SAM-dependent methyltransferase [Mycobacterium sp.]
TAHHGLAARWMKDNPHAAGNLGDAIPRLLRSVGFECTEVGTRRHRLIGQLTFYRATRPA